MPSYNVTFDDASPMIRYEGLWTDAGTGSSDSQKPRYANQTFHASQTASSRAIFKFNGTAVYIYGAKRFNHADFTVNIDGETQTLDGYAESPELFQELLYSKTSLNPNQEHEVTLTNSLTPQRFVDIDFIVATLGDGREGLAKVDQLDDTASAINYSGNWEVNGPTQFIVQSYNASYRATQQHDAFLTIPFSGNGIRLYGGTGANHGPYSVSLDGLEAEIFNGTTPSDVEYRGQQILYLASNLPSGSHTLTLTNLGPDGKYVDIDYYVQERWPSSSASSKLGPRVIVGIVFTSFIPLLLCLLAFIWYRRRNHKRQIPSVEAHGSSIFRSMPGPDAPVRPFIVIPTFPAASRISPASSLAHNQSAVLASTPEQWRSLPFSEKSHHHPYRPEPSSGLGTMESGMIFASNMAMDGGTATLSSDSSPKRHTRPPSYVSTF